MLNQYDHKILSRVYKTPYLMFYQDRVPMTAQAFEYTDSGVRRSDVCLAWVSFWEDDQWSEPELILAAEDDGHLFIQSRSGADPAERYYYYRVYPKEVHRSILNVIDERKTA